MKLFEAIRTKTFSFSSSTGMATCGKQPSTEQSLELLRRTIRREPLKNDDKETSLVVQNPPISAVDIPGPGTKIPHAVGQLSPWRATTAE